MNAVQERGVYHTYIARSLLSDACFFPLRPCSGLLLCCAVLCCVDLGEEKKEKKSVTTATQSGVYAETEVWYELLCIWRMD